MAGKVHQISIETAQSNLDCSVLVSLAGKAIMLGVIDLSDMRIETPEQAPPPPTTRASAGGPPSARYDHHVNAAPGNCSARIPQPLFRPDFRRRGAEMPAANLESCP
jgi:hypothetical protein